MVTDEAIQKKQKIDQLEKVICKLEIEKRAAELAFIQAHGLSVDDLADIEDEKEFNHYLGEFCSLPDIIAISEKIRTAEEEKKLIEDEIIEMIISIAPADAADDLQKCKRLVRFRKELIEKFLFHIAN